MRLIYNVSTRGTQNVPGVDIKVPGFGNTTTVELLDPSGASPGVYFKNIGKLLLIQQKLAFIFLHIGLKNS